MFRNPAHRLIVDVFYFTTKESVWPFLYGDLRCSLVKEGPLVQGEVGKFLVKITAGGQVWSLWPSQFYSMCFYNSGSGWKMCFWQTQSQYLHQLFWHRTSAHGAPHLTCSSVAPEAGYEYTELSFVLFPIIHREFPVCGGLWLRTGSCWEEYKSKIFSPMRGYLFITKRKLKK